LIDFATITAFRLVRRLATAQASTVMYLLIYEEDTESAIEADLRAEVEVQLATQLSIRRVSELQDLDRALLTEYADRIRVLWIDCWLQELVDLLDSHVVRLEWTGAQFLFLTTTELSEKLLVRAPNFRSRLTEVMRITPDDPSGGNLN
jgi:hypothetical protein